MFQSRKYRIHFKSPIQLGDTFISYKEGFYIQYQDIISECSPLPNYSKESLEECIQEFHEIPHKELSNYLQESDTFKSFESFCKTASLKSCLGLLNLKLHNKLLTTDIKTQTLLSHTNEDIKDLKGCLKVKISRAHLDEEVDFLKLLSKNEVLFRLDSNRSFKLSEAVEYYKAINFLEDKIDYFEEPLKNPKELELFYKKTMSHYALDENIVIMQNYAKSLSGLRALVIKPTLIGDLFDIRNVISSYTRYNENLKIVLSSSFETSVGIESLKNLAQLISPNEYHGFDTIKYIKEVEELP